MEETENRKQAIYMYLINQKPVEICHALHKSRPWFYKWLKRYQQDPKGEWYLDHPSVPKKITKSYAKEQEALVIQIRKKLDVIPYAQIGAISIQWEMQKLNMGPLPLWTIDRIIKRNGLNRTKPLASKRKNDYPDYSKVNTHELDLVGPRYLKRSGRYYFCNIIDTQTHCAQVNFIKNKKTEGIVNSIIRFWKHFGVPDFLQMDNELSFRGSNRYPHNFGLLIRFALSQGVVPVFIPQAEPWRNGIIEKFNDTLDKKFLKTQIFNSYEHLADQAEKFEHFHNQNYRYSAHNNRTPLQVFSQCRSNGLLNKHYKISNSVPLEGGDIIVVRFIRSNRQLNVFGETFMVDAELVYSYVEARISVEGQMLKIYLDDRLVQESPYPTPIDWL